MTTYIVFLRGINVGGSRRIKMADLRSALSKAGIADPRTLLQSGNLVFQSNGDERSVIDIVETTIETTFGFGTTAIVRTAAQMTQILEDHPFSASQVADSRFAHVGFCRGAPSRQGFSTLLELHEGPEELVLGDREVFVYYPEGSGRSKITNAALERHLETAVTSRNWNTLTKIAALLGASS